MGTENIPRSHKDSPVHELIWHTCRECRIIQNCVVVRGWYVCRICLEKIDEEFCRRRADLSFEKLK